MRLTEDLVEGAKVARERKEKLLHEDLAWGTRERVKILEGEGEVLKRELRALQRELRALHKAFQNAGLE